MRRLQWTTGSPEETEALGEAWGGALEPGDVLLLMGDLGTGKTTLVRGLARGLRIPAGVKSPTFALHHVHHGRLTLHHLDLYRIAETEDLGELGLEDVLGREGVTVVEWGERLRMVQSEALTVTLLDRGPRNRTITLEGPADPLDRLVRNAPGGTES